MKIGVLALQGAFLEHEKTLTRIGAEPVEVRLPEQLEGLDGLIIPGGESTTIGKVARRWGLLEPLRTFGRSGRPLWGTCAGMILLAEEVNDLKVENLGLIDIKVQRNAYGRQIDSFITEEKLSFLNGAEKFRMIFIRAPIILKYGDSVTPLGNVNGNIVIARNEHIMVSSFHPELTPDLRIHSYFISKMNE